MRTKLNFVVLGSRQFVTLLLVLFSLASITTVFLLAFSPSEGSLDRYQADSAMFERLGFLPPPIAPFAFAFVVATGFLAVINLCFWLKDRLRDSSDQPMLPPPHPRYPPEIMPE